MFFICNFSGRGQQLRAAHTVGYYRIVAVDGSVVCALRKRQAYPGTYCNQLNDGFELGYGQPCETDRAAEYLKVRVSSEQLMISRDVLATLPLFYRYDSDKVCVANDYASLVKPGLSYSDIDRDALSELLAVNDLQLGRTLTNIRPLQERENLLYDATGLQLTPPPQRTWIISSQVPASDPKAFRQMFDKNLDAFVRSRLAGQRFAFQISGGLDSSVLPLYMASRHHLREMVVGSVLLPASAGQSQAVKLNALCQRLQPSQVITTDMSLEHDYPLSVMLSSGRYRPFFVEDEVCYQSSLEHHAASLQTAGVKVLVTGVGGDDIFENITNGGEHYAFGAREQERRHQTPLPPYLTKLFRDNYQAALPAVMAERHIPLLPLSATIASYVNNTYIERGIWPVSPYLNYDLYRFCQGLPAYLRANKNILRAYCQASDFPTEIYVSGKGESLNNALTQFFCSNLFTRTVRQFLYRAITVQMGWVDPDRLLETLLHEQARGNDNEWLFAVYQWLCAEINLQVSLAKT